MVAGAEPRRWADVRSAADWRRAFDEADDLTLGIEEELFLVDGERFEPAPLAAELLARLAGDVRFKHELSAAQIEIATPVCRSAAEALAALADARARLVEAARGLARLAGTGLHP